MKLAECSTYDRATLTLLVVQYINQHIRNRSYCLGKSSDVVLYECIHEVRSRHACTQLPLLYQVLQKDFHHDHHLSTIQI